MNVKTNTGETVDLSRPENVLRGMMFLRGEGSYVVTCDRQY